jgi:diacylglycerol kinase family enzyme
MESIAVVINAGAGQGHGRELADKVTEAFARVGLAAQVSLAADGRELAASVRAALSRGERRIVAGGGDGTINQVAGVLHDSQAQAVLGVLPLGTLNHFAKDLGLPLELEEAVRVAAEVVVRQVDVEEVNGLVFVKN